MELTPEWGSATAKGGFRNEHEVALKFGKWKSDPEAMQWLRILGYKENIRDVSAKVCGGLGGKADICVTIKVGEQINKENISLKKFNKNVDFNQIDKRWVNDYKKILNLSNDITTALKCFCGENGYQPEDLLKTGKINRSKFNSLRDKRRFFLDELDKGTQKEIIRFFDDNKEKIMSIFVIGKGEYKADWILATEVDEKIGKTRWVLRTAKDAIKILLQDDVKITPRGNLDLCRISMQRKGGDNGRKTAQMLQFKVHAGDFFENN